MQGFKQGGRRHQQEKVRRLEKEKMQTDDIALKT